MLGTTVGFHVHLRQQLFASAVRVRPMAGSRCLDVLPTQPRLLLQQRPRLCRTLTNRSSQPSIQQSRSDKSAQPELAEIDTTTPERPAKRQSLISRLTSKVSLQSTKGASSENGESETGASSVRKLISLAKPESRHLSVAVGLVSPTTVCKIGIVAQSYIQLLVSSSVSMLVPLTIGKLIDFFSTNSVSAVQTNEQIEQC